MFPVTSNIGKESMQRQFTYNVSRRCSTEFNRCFNDPEIQRKLSYVTDAMSECYKGYHGLCIRHSYTCTGNKEGL